MHNNSSSFIEHVERMKINTKVSYGLKAMIEICNNSHKGGIFQKDIAESQGISLNYLDTIISGLRNSGLITNYLGKSSGYVLAKKPANISVYDVYRAFEPELSLVNCSCKSTSCLEIETCQEKCYWFKLNDQIKQLMKKSNILEVAQKEKNIFIIH